ncbi:MAG TPA: hypothetical protein DCP36_08255, partial [Sporomusaceae bacterium]|nr:hypothetical protein [Sporomusaceae bacterium]
MDTLGLQLERLLAGTVTANNNVIFENIINSYGTISYDPLTGVVTISKPGRYMVNWWVATQAVIGSNGISFSIVTSQGDELLGDTPIKTDEVVGFALVQVDSAPITLSLVNSTPATVSYSSLVPVKAALVLIEVPEETSATGETGST